MWIITGTGRSGTSLVCQILYNCGADFGPVEKLQPSDTDNPRGYFEQQEINALNINLLLGTWANPALHLQPSRNMADRMQGTLQRAMYVLPVSSHRMLRRARHYANSIDALTQEYSHRFVKDPRFSRTLPVWREYASIDGIIFSYRHPSQVARSLGAAYGAPTFAAHHEWRQRVQAFLNDRGDLPVHLVAYSQLLGSRPHRLREVDALLSATGMSSGDAAAVADQVLEPSLSRFTDSPTSSLPASLAPLWDELQALHASQFTE